MNKMKRSSLFRDLLDVMSEYGVVNEASLVSEELWEGCPLMMECQDEDGERLMLSVMLRKEETQNAEVVE